MKGKKDEDEMEEEKKGKGETQAEGGRKDECMREEETKGATRIVNERVDFMKVEKASRVAMLPHINTN